ncbi:MAG: hypothetical protein MZW92_72635 [Comamonadaceae bacterium]|nr:hypothetical protein [Comamonadaceae bacterium]
MRPSWPARSSIPTRGRAARHHPAGRTPATSLIVDGDRRRGHHQPAAHGPEGVPRASGQVRRSTGRRARRVATGAAWPPCDERPVLPMANIELPEEIGHALSYGAEGVGLFRSEFIYLQRTTLPTTRKSTTQSTTDLATGRRTRARFTSGRSTSAATRALPQLKIRSRAESRPWACGRSAFRSGQPGAVPDPDPGHPPGLEPRGNVRVIIPMITEMEEIGEVKAPVRSEAREELAAQEPGASTRPCPSAS